MRDSGEDEDGNVKQFLNGDEDEDEDGECKTRIRMDYMASHTKWMERFENSIFKQQEKINDKMAEMFRLLKELTTSKVPEKVLIKEEAKSPVTKNIHSISLSRGKEERKDHDYMVVDNDINETNTKMPVKEAEKDTKAENGTKNKPIKKLKEKK
nr:hypothetical protein [Tanacetum cinerariifolium]